MGLAEGALEEEELVWRQQRGSEDRAGAGKTGPTFCFLLLLYGLRRVTSPLLCTCEKGSVTLPLSKELLRD